MTLTTRIRSIAILCAATAAIVAAAAPARAQDEHRFTLNAGGGYSPLVGQISNRLGNGWHATVGGGYRFSSHFETNLQFMYSGFGVKDVVLAEAAVPSATSHLWSISLDPKLRMGGDRKFDFYVVGGVGYYRRTVQFTAPTIQPEFFFDPFFDTFFLQFLPADVILGSITRSGIGGSGGGGFDIKLHGSGLRFFTEARFHYAATGRIPTRMVPVTIGLQW